MFERCHHTFILLATAAGLLSGCGGGSAPSPTPPQGDAPRESALAASKPGELLEYVKTKLRSRNDARQQDARAVIFPGVPLEFANLGVAFATTADSGQARSSTTVQEPGVDEEDLLKTDGNLIYALVPQEHRGDGDAPAVLQIHERAADGKLQPRGRLELTSPDQESEVWLGSYLYAPAGRVAIVGESRFPIFIDCPPTAVCIQPVIQYTPMAGRANVTVVNAAAPNAPAVERRISIDGRLLGTRLVGQTLYIVAAHTPNLPVDAIAPSATAAAREAELAKLTVADIVPKIRIDGGPPQPLLGDTDCFIQPKNASLGIEITSFTAIDLAARTIGTTSRCFAGGSEAFYLSPATLYLATTRWQVPLDPTARPIAPDFVTDVHKFALTARVVDYRGSGEVAGHLGWDSQRKPYRMSEHNGDLRVLTFTGSFGWIGAPSATVAPSPATLTILRERSSDKSLQPVAKLPNERRPAPLGRPGEQVYGVRFAGDRGYVVTFRQIDPLYVLDLADPADPKAAGELKVTGFSDWLYPLPGGLLLGVGKEASEEGRVGGVKVALFDVRDAANPQEIRSMAFGSAGSVSALDFARQGISLFARGNLTRIALPMVLRGQDLRTAAQGLYRFEVDSQARALQAKPAIAPSGRIENLWSERSLQIGEQVYWLSNGRLAGHDW